jgi:hypothetical protein
MMNRFYFKLKLKYLIKLDKGISDLKLGNWKEDRGASIFLRIRRNRGLLITFPKNGLICPDLRESSVKRKFKFSMKWENRTLSSLESSLVNSVNHLFCYLPITLNPTIINIYINHKNSNSTHISSFS